MEKAAREEANISLLFLKQIMEAYGPIWGGWFGDREWEKTSTKKITTKSGKANGSRCG